MDRRLGRRSGRVVPALKATEVERLFRERYPGFKVRHFHEHLRRSHARRHDVRGSETCLGKVERPAPYAGCRGNEICTLKLTAHNGNVP